MRKLLPFLAVSVVLSMAANAQAVSRATFTLPSGVIVTVTEAPFNKSRFHVSGCSGNGACLINGRIPFGFGAQLPNTYVKSITVTFKGHTYALDASDMYDAWQNRPLEYKGIRYFGGKCDEPGYCQFRGLFSDGIGSFVAEWSVVDGRAFRTVLTSSDDIVDLISKHIDPPEYE
jgi:hypothetical protein